MAIGQNPFTAYTSEITYTCRIPCTTATSTQHQQLQNAPQTHYAILQIHGQRQLVAQNIRTRQQRTYLGEVWNMTNNRYYTFGRVDVKDFRDAFSDCFNFLPFLFSTFHLFILALIWVNSANFDPIHWDSRILLCLFFFKYQRLRTYIAIVVSGRVSCATITFSSNIRTSKSLGTRCLSSLITDRERERKSPLWWIALLAQQWQSQQQLLPQHTLNL